MARTARVRVVTDCERYAAGSVGSEVRALSITR